MSGQGMRLARSAPGWVKSIIRSSRQWRKKSFVMVLLSKTLRKQLPLNIHVRVLIVRIHTPSTAFMRVAGVLLGQHDVMNPHGLKLQMASIYWLIFTHCRHSSINLFFLSDFSSGFIKQYQPTNIE
jgi:hypothetical protein